MGSDCIETQEGSALHNAARRDSVILSTSLAPGPSGRRASRRAPTRRSAWTLTAGLGVVLAGCGATPVDLAWSDWERLDVSFRPAHEPPPSFTATSSLEDYVEVALARNPRLQAQAQRWRADLERLPQVGTLPDPQVTYGDFIEPVETRIGPQRRKFGVMQRFPWPGKLVYASGVAEARAEAARARTEATRLRIVYEVTEAYADYYFLARERAVTQETMTLVRHWESIAQVRFRSGLRAAHRDVIKAQVEIGRLEDRLATLNDARKPRVERLRALLNLARGTDIPWPEALPERTLSLDDVAVAARIGGTSPVLAEHDRQVAAGERGVELAEQGYFPDLTVGFDYIQTDRARFPGVRGSGDDAAVLMFGINLPIWIGRTRAAVLEAEARLRAAELERRAAENALDASVTQALFDYRDAERKLRLFRDSLIPKAEQSLRAAGTAFESGDGAFLDVLDAERVLLEFHLAHEKALADRVRSLAALEMHVGVDLSGPAGEEDR